jgi:hypothetical protein
MTRLVTLLTRAEAAERLGWVVKSVDKARQRTAAGQARVPFPEPLQILAGSPLWSVSQIDRYAARIGKSG